MFLVTQTKINNFWFNLAPGNSLKKVKSAIILFIVLSNKKWQLFILFVLAFIWGSSFILMKRGMEVYSANQVASLRIFIAFISLFPFFIKYLRAVDKKKIPFFVIVGLFGNGIPAFLFTSAQTGISSSLSGMLNSLTPLFTILIGALFFKTHVTFAKIIGVVLGLIGAVGLIWAGGIEHFGNNLLYGLLVIAATLCYAISVNTIKTHLQQTDAMIVTSMAFFFIGIPIGTYLFTTDFIAVTKNNPHAASALGYIFILSTIGTSLAVLVFNFLIKHTSAVFASSVTYLIPITAIFWGWLDGESLNLLHLLFITLILFAVYMVNKK